MIVPSFVSAGTGVATLTTTLALVAPTCQIGDYLFALIVSNNNTALVLPSSSWTTIQDVSNTAAMRTAVAYKVVGSGDSGATFNFTVNGTTLSFGVLVAYRGSALIGTSSSSANISADAVTYATITTNPNALVVAFGAYNLNATTAGAMSGTDPTFTNRVDIETATGNTASLFVYDGSSSGAAVGSRTHATTSTVDAINHGFLVELRPSNDAQGMGSGSRGFGGITARSGLGFPRGGKS
jgi:hypothetical protein